MRQKGEPDKAGGKENPLFGKVARYAAIGLEFPSTVIGGMFLGYLLDRYFETSPLLTTIATLLALAGAFIRLVQLLNRFSSRDR